ncbi:glycerol-3-phosphate acyltransferase 3 isoform X3 [Drosophila sulfurigaster albostrigata]|uniref:glycerol-3-phosphate acyltransferase 3 isoform X3 n=1 Tax=Drosophila sulfurigaster albostrigata TaxID=89887 RepID=UPI002D2190EA|nr:glycerol-3-phosphate acyltransferase 3 isoform X3 [Drosophila sulfurigaster albostrigata]
MFYGIINICWIPFAGFVSFLVLLSAINKSVGVRRAYVNILLRIFEYGRVSIESASKVNQAIAKDKINVDQTPGVEQVDGSDAKETNEATNGSVLITRDVVLLPEAQESAHDKTNGTKKEEICFDFENCLDYVKSGVEAIIEDDVTSRFEAEELKSWNMLTRTNRHYEFISWKITMIWVIGFAIRYTILMPLRVLVCFIGVVWLTLCTAAVGNLKDGKLKRAVVSYVLGQCFGVLSSAISAVITYHNEDNRPSSGICVANHTSPIDVLVLMCDTTYSLIGQRHGGFLGVLQRALARASPHIWFERGEAKDRHLVAERLKQHVSDPNNPPILIFPEGTCINNTSVMQFKKGSFEVGGVIYPVAIKYDPRFGDAFWNSSKYSMMQYLYMMMTSWAIVCDVWYLPPMYRQEGESAIDFANRVKGVIAKQGGLVDLVWDGQLKRMKPKKEWREIQQIEFANRLKSD